jgi:hypothetical protein
MGVGNYILMEYTTSFRKINGTWYCLIPVGFAEHLKLDGNILVDGMIRTETNKRKQPYCSVWVKGV